MWEKIKFCHRLTFSFRKIFQNFQFSLIQLNGVFNLATTCLATRNSQRERQRWKASSFFFSKRSGSSCHDKVFQSYGSKCEAWSCVKWVPFLKAWNSVTWSTSLGNIFWSFLIYKVIYITNENWKYLIFMQIQLHTSME